MRSAFSGPRSCQGRAPLVNLTGSGPFGARYRLIDTILPGARDRDESSLFEGINTSLAGLDRYAGASPPSALRAGLATIATRVDNATRALSASGPAATIPELAAGLKAVRALRTQLGSMGLDEADRYEIDFRLLPKEEQFQQALVLAHALRIDAASNDGVIIGGQPVNISVAVANRGDNPIEVRSVSLTGFDGPGRCTAGSIRPAAVYTCASEVKVPTTAALTGPYWDRPEDAGRAVFAPDAPKPFGLPFRPTPFTARIEMDIAGASVTHAQPVQLRYEGAGLAGEKRMELKVVPAFSVNISPKIAVVPLGALAASSRPPTTRPGDSQSRELRVTVINGNKGPETAAVRLRTPAGWRATPSTERISFSREDEAITTRFMVTPPPHPVVGDVQITAEVSRDATAAAEGTRPFDVGYQVIEYPHIQRRHKLIPATATMKVLDVAVAHGLHVGYIMGVGDQVPPALQQLGAKLTFIDNDEMAWGDLSKYDTIVTGVRAYERREDLRANNHRLLKYVESGGTVVVQYNKMEFNQATYAPYRALVSSARVTDEHAPVRVLVPEHPVFRWPNRIDDRAWTGWVQERGLYFLGERDPKFVDLVSMEDPFDYNKGVKTGALVEAKYGKGRWLYVGLGLWRQLPSGTDGAYKLFANLISLGKEEGRRKKDEG